MGKQKTAYLYASLVVVFWSTIGSAFKISLRHTQVLPLLLCSSLVATAVLLGYLVATGRLGLLREFTRGDYRYSAVLGFLNPFLYYVVLIHAYDLLRAQEASALNFVWPIVLVLLSIPILKQKIGLRSIIAVFVSFFGVLIVATHGRVFGMQFTSGLGVALALGSAIAWALYWIYNVRDKRDEAVRLFVNFAFGSVYVLILTLVRGQLLDINAAALLGGVYVGLFELGITFLLWLRALKLSKTTAHVANIVYLVPFVGLGVISVAVGEEILLSTVVGLVFIVAGIVLQRL